MSLAARLYGIGDLRMQDETGPGSTPAGWSRVAVTSVGICGSDLHWFTEGGIGEVTLQRPVVPCHEFAAVALDGPYAGRRLAVDPAIPCGRCELCREDHGNLCPYVRFAGHGDLDGALQQEVVWPDWLLHPLPDSLTDDAGALLEPLGVAIHVIALAHVRLGQDVLILGAGPIGILAAQVARRSGARRVFVSEPLAQRRYSALRFGADEVWTPEEVNEGLGEATAGRGADVVIELAGTDDVITTAVQCARPGARIALGGIPSERRSSFPAAEARRKGLTFMMVRRMHHTYRRAIALAMDGIDLDDLVTARYPLSESPAAFRAAAAREGNKIIISVSG